MSEDTDTQDTADTAESTTATQGADGGDATAGAWWEKEGIAAETRQFLTQNGLTVDDPIQAATKAADMARHAQSRLGHKPETLMTKPKEGQALSDWMRDNRELFGLPEAAEDYSIAKPEGFKGEWDADLAGKMQAAGFDAGIPPEAMGKLTEVFAGHVSGLLDQAQDSLAEGIAAMRAELASDWGGEYQANVSRAQHALQVVGEQAGLDADALQNVAATLSAKAGDANVLRLFHAIGEAMGDDTALGLGRGAGGFATTPAEARAEAAKLRAPGGEYFEATKSNDRAAIARVLPRLQQLDKLASGSA